MFRILLVLVLLTVSWDAAASYANIEDKGGLRVLTPSLALRTSEKIRLDNGLQVYLISDPDADKSAVALVVKAGSWDEPADKPGLAHFLEHMLFMGTRKYPDENNFDQYLADNGGTTDAFTASDFTAFVFDVDTPAFEGAVDRFSRFFSEPAFNPSGVVRELHAIDQEYLKNVQEDEWREQAVLRELSDPHHPFHGFNMGNSRTLSGVNRASLIDWYQTHYSAGAMRLVVISPLPLGTLKGLAVAAFSGIKDLGPQKPPSERPTVNPQNLAHMVYIEPFKARRILKIIWEVPPKFIDLETKPVSLVCRVLGDEGPNSLLALLKGEGLADTIICGLMETSEKVQQLTVSLGLTPKGVRQADIVIEKVFQALALLREEGVPEYIYEDARELAKLAYQYQSRLIPFNDVLRHAEAVAYEPMETYPIHTYVPQRFDPQLVAELIAYLTPQRAYYQLVAPETLTGVKPLFHEQWLGGEYAIKPIPESLLARWAHITPNPQIHLPKSNPYIPEQLSLVNPQEEALFPSPQPLTIVDDGGGTVYYAADTQFGLPEVDFRFYLKTPQVNPTPFKAAMADLFARYVTESLASSSYAANVAGLRFRLDSDDYGILLQVYGFSDKALLFLEAVLRGLKVGSVDAGVFARVKKVLADDYSDSAKEAPYVQAVEWLQAALYKQFARPAEKEKALQKIDLIKFSQFTQELFSKVYLESVLYGNLTKEEAVKAASLVTSTLESTPYPKGKGLEDPCVPLPADGGPFYLQKETDVLGNAALLAIEDGPFDYKGRGCQQILMQALTAPFFSELRTRQQTGYITVNYAIDITREIFSCFLVQSHTQGPRDLAARFELFLEGWLREMREHTFPPERFERIKTSLIEELKHPAKNQEEMTDYLFKMAFKYKGDFKWFEKRIAALQSLTYDECVNWAHAHYGVKNKRRLAVGIKGKVSAEEALLYRQVGGLRQLRKMQRAAE